MAGFGLLTMHNGGINFKEIVQMQVGQVGLEIKRSEGGCYYITLNNEVVHGGIYTKASADSHLSSYQKIYDAGVRKGVSQK